MLVSLCPMQGEVHQETIQWRASKCSTTESAWLFSEKLCKFEMDTHCSKGLMVAECGNTKWITILHLQAGYLERHGSIDSQQSSPYANICKLCVIAISKFMHCKMHLKHGIWKPLKVSQWELDTRNYSVYLLALIQSFDIHKIKYLFTLQTKYKMKQAHEMVM